MEPERCVGALVLLVALFILYTNLLPYWQLYQFWSVLGFPGLLVMNTFWLINYGPMTLFGGCLFVVGIYLVKKG